MIPYLIIIIASILLLILIRSIDKDKQSTLLISILFIFGLCSFKPVATMNTFFKNNYLVNETSWIHTWLNTWLTSGLSEELVKFIILFIFTCFNKRLKTWYDAIVYSAVVSVGLSTIENIGYTLIADGDELNQALTRIILSLVGHCTYAIVMGCFYGLSKICLHQKKYKKSVVSFVLAILIPMVLHTSYNTMLELFKSTIRLCYVMGMIECFISIIVICYVLKNNRPLRMTEEFDKKMMPYEYKLLPKEILAIISVLAVYSVLWFVYALIRGIIVVTF